MPPASTALLLVASLCLLAIVSGNVPFTVELNETPSEWVHFFSKCVGSGHATLALRSDWRQQLQQCHNDLKVEYVRFHGLLDDDMSTYLPTEPSTKPYSFFNVDSIFDFLVSIGMKPVVELSFMPAGLASNASQTIFHYKGGTSPPSNYSQFADFIGDLALHLVERYGIQEVSTWYFEVWNEPNCGFWSGSQQDYFDLFTVISESIAKVDSRLRVGGPVTCQSQWIADFRNLVVNESLHASFISTHEYPTDIKPLSRDIMRKVINQTMQEAAPFPVLYTETNDGLYFSLNGTEYHDDPYAAAWAFFNVQDIMPLATSAYSPPLQFLSWWTFSDVSCFLRFTVALHVPIASFCF